MDKGFSYDKLNALIERLPPTERALLQLIAVIREPTGKTTVHRCVQACLIEVFERFRGQPTGIEDLSYHLKHLRKLHLIGTQLECHPAVIEVVVRQAIADSRFEALTGATRQILPFDPFQRTNGPAPCARNLRELRIAFHIGDAPLFNRCYTYLFEHCSADYTHPDPVVSICNSPFDAEWFSQLPMVWQVFSLSRIFSSAIWRLTDDQAALSYGLKTEFRERIPPDDRAGADSDLISRCLAGGELTEARKILETSPARDDFLGLLGLLAFLEGNYDQAVKMLATDLQELRRRTRKRNAYFLGFTGVAYPLAVLLRSECPDLSKVRQILQQAMSQDGMANPLKIAYRSLNAVALAQEGEVQQTRTELADVEDQGASPWGWFFHTVGTFWVEAQLDPEMIAALSEIFIAARDARQHWLAMECAELLCRAEQETPLRRNYIQQVRRDLGLVPFVARIPVEEPWRRRLRALMTAADGTGQVPAPVSNTRLVWLVNYRYGQMTIQPKIQKFSSKGVWTEGRPVALSRLYSGADLECLAKQDQAIRAALERRVSGYYGVSYSFNMARALPALVGHPLLFLESNPRVSVEIIRGEPEVLVRETQGGITIEFQPGNIDTPVAVLQESQTRFRLVQLTEQHQRIARIIGETGLTVPASARSDVVAAISGLSSQMTVHSAIGGHAKDIVEVHPDPTPWVHLIPVGGGFRLEMFVKPFGESGPHLKPGSGMPNVMAEVDGTRLQTRRDLADEFAKAGAVETACPTLATAGEGDRQWLLQDPEECLQLLLDLKSLQDRNEARVAWPEGEKLKVTQQLSFEHLRLKVRGKTDWFEVSGQLQVDENLTIDMKQLLELLHQHHTRFLPLGEGQFLALTRDLQKRLEELESFSETRGDRLQLHPLAVLALQDFTDRLSHLDADIVWKTRTEAIREGLQQSFPLLSTLKARLRDYQVEGYKWLARLAALGIGACLADDMGLGKTLQALAIILKRAPDGPTLVVAPTSVCMNWLAEAQRYAPTLNVIPFGGANREALVGKLGGMDMLVCSYGLLQQEAELLRSQAWHTIVLDEAQAIKNITTKRAQAAMTLEGNFKLITTGTPIENHLGELHTLFHFINPGLLGSRDRFNDRFATPIERYNDRDAARRLKRLIKPFILRRTKAQVLEELPPRTEVILQVELTQEEAAFYEALRRSALERLEQDDAPAGQKHFKILTEIMKLRRACCHPRLVAPGTNLGSSKLELFAEVVSELLENGHKALVFSQFVSYLALIRELLDNRKIDYRYLDGATSPKERKKEVDAFQAGSGDLFLISLKAGGLGLNLTAADYVIHMDPWWNPAVEDQASDRAHRIGQQHPVTVYRLVTNHTIEQKIVQLHHDKRDLANSLLEGTDVSGKISAEELLQLLREG